MNAPIKTNQLTYKFNNELFSKNYDIFCIHTSEKYFKNGAYIIDAPLLSNNVCSVLFESGKEFFVLMKSNDANISLLKDAILKEDGTDRITISQVAANSLKDDLVFQLMLNSLGNYESPLLKFNNLTGHLYCFHPNWLIRGRKSEAGVIFKVPCLELRLSPEFRLNMEVHTFTSELLRNKIEFKKKKFEEYPKYVFSAHNTLRRKLHDDMGYSFIMRQTKNVKTEIAFLDIQNINRFNQSKMGILTTVLENFNDIENSELVHNVNQALRAHGIMKKDIERFRPNTVETSWMLGYAILGNIPLFSGNISTLVIHLLAFVIAFLLGCIVVKLKQL